MKPEVVPTIDKEKCKAGEVCYLQVNVSSTDDHMQKGTDSQTQLFLYEVVPDDKYWAVSGKTKGESSLVLFESSVFMHFQDQDQSLWSFASTYPQP